ncbi:hypothetical protein MB46_00115 [Arthrobacter alpinus]|nr:hypothetical protein MB46_00115 [Arthrobacter alpinus]
MKTGLQHTAISGSVLFSDVLKIDAETLDARCVKILNAGNSAGAYGEFADLGSAPAFIDFEAILSF